MLMHNFLGLGEIKLRINHADNWMNSKIGLFVIKVKAKALGKQELAGTPISWEICFYIRSRTKESKVVLLFSLLVFSSFLFFE